jgi:hypothetical protein
MARVSCGTAVLLAFALTGSVQAQNRDRGFGYQGVGPRVGLSIEPDQFVVGGHADLGEAFPHVRFQPNGEIGFGNGGTTIQLDADLHYRFLNEWDVWNPYLGGGLGWVHYSLDEADGSKFQIHVVAGIEKYISDGKFFLETKLGAVDESPDWKFLAGWTFMQ